MKRRVPHHHSEWGAPFSRFDSGTGVDAVPETSHVEIPYWLVPAGAAFERAWATDRRAELAEILADAYRTGYQRGSQP